MTDNRRRKSSLPRKYIVALKNALESPWRQLSSFLRVIAAPGSARDKAKEKNPLSRVATVF